MPSLPHRHQLSSITKYLPYLLAADAAWPVHVKCEPLPSLSTTTFVARLRDAVYAFKNLHPLEHQLKNLAGFVVSERNSAIYLGPKWVNDNNPTPPPPNAALKLSHSAVTDEADLRAICQLLSHGILVGPVFVPIIPPAFRDELERGYNVGFSEENNQTIII